MHSSHYIEHYLQWTCSRPRNTTALQPNVFLTRIHWLLSQTREDRLSPSHKICQGQLHAPQSVSVAVSTPIDEIKNLICCKNKETTEERCSGVSLKYGGLQCEGHVVISNTNSSNILGCQYMTITPYFVPEPY